MPKPCLQKERVVPNDDIDKLLADFDSDEDSTAPDADVLKNRPNAVKQLRDWGKGLERELNKERKANQELKAFKDAFELKEKVNTLRQAGLSEQQASIYLKMYDGEISPENVGQFKETFWGPSDKGEEAPREEVKVGNFAPTGGYQEPGSKRYTKAQFEALMRENQAEGWRVLNSGLVDF